MRRKTVLIGLVIVIVAAVLFILSGFLLSNGLGSKISVINSTIGPGNFSYSTIQYSNATALALYVAVDNITNLYLLNGTAYSRWSNYMQANRGTSGISYITSMGVNSSYIKRNVTVAIVPLDFKIGSLSMQNNPSEQVYVVIDNTPGSASTSKKLNATISYLPLQSSKLVESAALGYIVIILFIAGIIVIVYGFLRKDASSPANVPEGKKSEKETKEKEYVEQLYKGVKSKKSSKSDSKDND